MLEDTIEKIHCFEWRVKELLLRQEDPKRLLQPQQKYLSRFSPSPRIGFSKPHHHNRNQIEPHCHKCSKRRSTQTAAATTNSRSTQTPTNIPAMRASWKRAVTATSRGSTFKSTTPTTGRFSNPRLRELSRRSTNHHSLHSL